MRSLDIFTEKQAGDSRQDKIASSLLLSESNSLSMTQLVHDLKKNDGRLDKNEQSLLDARRETEGAMQQRDKMAFMSIVLGSPFMLLSMGAGMAVFDENRMNRDGKLADKVLGNRQLKLSRVLNEDTESRISKKALSVSFESIMTKVDGRQAEKAKPREKHYFSTQPRYQPQPSPERSWVKASKLLKKKLALQDQLEKFRGQMQLSAVADIVAHIEKLDKALKQMGC